MTAAATGADVGQLTELRIALSRTATSVAHEQAAADAALRRFASRSSEFVPTVPAHGVRGDELARRLRDLGHRVQDVRDATRAADRWIGTRIAITAYRVADAAGTIADQRDVVRVGWSRFRATALGEHAAEATTEALDRALVRRWQGRAAAGVQRVRTSAVGAFVGRQGARLARFLAEPRVVRVRQVGGKAMAVAGFALSANDVVQGVREGDTERAVTGGIGVVASAAMVSGVPPVQLAGAVVSGGLLVYEYRHEIADGARAVGRAVGDMAGAAADFIGGLF